MPNYRYHHAHFMSPEPIKTAEFYEKTFGAEIEEVIKFQDGDAMVHLRLHGSRIWVSGSRSNPPFYGLHHIGISTDDIETSVAELKASGAEFLEKDIVEPQPGVRAINFRAPNNAIIELWADPSDL